MAVIEHPDTQPQAAPWVGVEAVPERAGRADLRAQIARLERELAHVAAAAYPRLDMSPITAHLDHRGPRVLELGELEQVRDALADRLTTLRTAALVQAEEQAEARDELERMLADPPAHRGKRMTNAQLGLPGCTVYEVVPRLGPLGRLASWWQVKVSSGCPLAWGP
jgi:hypothetical protein